MSVATKGRKVGSRAVAELFGVSERRIQQLVQEGVITARPGSNGAHQYDLLDAAGEYIRHLSDKLKGVDNDRDNQLERDKLEAEVLLKRTRARQAELQLMEQEGAMHRSEDVAALTASLTQCIRDALDALPGRLAMDLAELRTPAEVSARMQKEVRALLRQLADYRYNPAEYRRRVRERAGLKGQDESEPE